MRLLVALCQGNPDKVQLNGQHGLSTDFDSHTKLCFLLNDKCYFHLPTAISEDA